MQYLKNELKKENKYNFVGLMAFLICFRNTI